MKNKTLSNFIYGIIYMEVIDDETSPFQQLIRKTNDIDKDYFEKIPADSETLPVELTPKLKNTIVTSIESLADELLQSGFKEELKRKIQQAIDQFSPIPDHFEIASNKKKALNNLKNTFLRLSSQYRPCPFVTDDDLEKKYKDASQRTLCEHIFKNNHNDIIEYHHALMYCTVWECKRLIENKIMEFISEILED